jgi:hypothetical protein
LIEEIMASHMAMFYEPQTTQVNEKLTSNSSLDLTLTQNPHDEDPKPQKVHIRLEIDPP